MAILLILNGVFNAVVWPAFFRRVLRDPRARDADGKATRFLTVHVVLFAIAMLLAVAFVVAAILALTA